MRRSLLRAEVVKAGMRAKLERAYLDGVAKSCQEGTVEGKLESLVEGLVEACANPHGVLLLMGSECVCQHVHCKSVKVCAVVSTQ